MSNKFIRKNTINIKINKFVKGKALYLYNDFKKNKAGIH